MSVPTASPSFEPNDPLQPGVQEFELWANHMRWLVRIRWWAIPGLFAAALFARLTFKLDVPLTALTAIAAGAICLNAYTTRVLRDDRYHPHLALVQILGDLVALTATLFVSGGIRNPFFNFYFFEIVLAGILLPRKTGYAVVGLITVLFLSLFLAPELARLEEPEGIFAREYFLHAAGAPFCFILTALLTAYLMNVMMRDLRQRQRQVRAERDRRRQAEKLASLGQLAGGVAHEINTPLGTISMAAEDTLSLCERGALDTDDLHETLKVIRDQTRRCSDITRSLLNFSRQTDVCYERIRLADLIQETLAMLRHRAEETPIEIRTNDPEVNAMADAGAVRQILLNLLNNALDAVEEQPERHIEVICDTGESEATLDVTDNGPGIGEADRGHIFEPFFTTKDVGRGTGLGLAISYGLAVDMGGGLELLESRPGCCRFRLRLPLEPAE